MFRLGDKVRLNKFITSAIVVGVYGEWLWVKVKDNPVPLIRLAAHCEAAED